MAYKRPDDGLKAATRYLKKCDTITIRPLKADGERIRSAAESSGMSMTKFIMTAIDEYIKKHSSAAQPAEEEEDDDDWLEVYMNAISPNHPDNVKKIN